MSRKTSRPRSLETSLKILAKEARREVARRRRLPEHLLPRSEDGDYSLDALEERLNRLHSTLRCPRCRSRVTLLGLLLTCRTLGCEWVGPVREGVREGSGGSRGPFSGSLSASLSLRGALGSGLAAVGSSGLLRGSSSLSGAASAFSSLTSGRPGSLDHVAPLPSSVKAALAESGLREADPSDEE